MTPSPPFAMSSPRYLCAVPPSDTLSPFVRDCPAPLGAVPLGDSYRD